MSLRINTNVPSLIALNNLRVTDARQQKSLQRLSTGLKAERSADDPFGVALSETLRAQMRALKQATSNTENAGNLVNVAESALSQITDLLHGIRESLVFAQQNTVSEQELAAEQDSVDSAIQAIRRIADTTSFGEVDLLNGNAEFLMDNVSSASIVEVRPVRMRFNPTLSATPFDLDVTASAAPATLSPGAVAGGEVTLLIQGERGSQTIRLADGTTASGVASAIDNLRDFTGVYGSGTSVYSEGFGTEAMARIEVIDGAGTIGGQGVGSVLYDEGQDAVALFQGSLVSGNGRVLTITNPFFTGDIELRPGAFGQTGFTVQRSGLLFQLGGETVASNQETIGIPNMQPSRLGREALTIGGRSEGGYLDSLLSGGANDLRNNPGNAVYVLDYALEDVNTARAALGAFVANIVEPAGRANQIAAENLAAADSTIRDADFAEEIAELTRNQVLFQSGISVLAQTQALPETVLQLITG